MLVFRRRRRVAAELDHLGLRRCRVIHIRPGATGMLGEVLDPLAEVHLERLQRDAVRAVAEPRVQLVLERDQRLDVARAGVLERHGGVLDVHERDLAERVGPVRDEALVLVALPAVRGEDFGDRDLFVVGAVSVERALPCGSRRNGRAACARILRFAASRRERAASAVTRFSRGIRYTCTYASTTRQSVAHKMGRARAGSTISRRTVRAMRAKASSGEEMLAPGWLLADRSTGERGHVASAA